MMTLVKIPALLFALSFFPLSVVSNVPKPHCDSAAVVLDSADFSIDLYLSTQAPKDVTVIDGGYVQMSFNGDTLLVVDPEGIEFSGPCTGLDLYPLADLFDQIVERSVKSAAEDGVIVGSTNCLQPSTIDVYVPICVTRTGSGASTLFLNVDECVQSVRTVEYCIVNGVASASVVSTSGCASNCLSGEATCAANGSGSIE